MKYSIGKNPNSRNGFCSGPPVAIGAEAITRRGYLIRKLSDRPSIWRCVHILRWEAMIGPIPTGMKLKCKGDRLNTDPSNWELASNRIIGFALQRGYENAPDELKPTIMAVAKLKDLADTAEPRARRPHNGVPVKS